MGRYTFHASTLRGMLRPLREPEVSGLSGADEEQGTTPGVSPARSAYVSGRLGASKHIEPTSVSRPRCRGGRGRWR
ncbi:hypothetical protein C5746_01775 [Streptomyces atratus]|uniref:Uncharacterized protein n=1 Tax=Streptomyces atratus TaxID=1893 RepID=A0A2Z5J6N1_STRAR|nr:hypothetical protein C5746_01775 [Streptomyces atratus]